MLKILKNKWSGSAVDVELSSRVFDTRIGGSVTTVVRARTEDQPQAVYDLTVADEPEFFANGILVHNSFDGARMAVMGKVMQAIEEFIREPPPDQEDVIDVFLGGY